VFLSFKALTTYPSKHAVAYVALLQVFAPN